MTAAIAAGDFTGDTRATARVTIQMSALGLYQNDGLIYSSVLFPNSGYGAQELPNVKSVNWNRSVDDVASMTMELFNTKPLPSGTGPDTGDSFDLLGYYTYNRGRTSYSQSNWGHSSNEWQDMLVPDRLVRVYQGCGADYTVLPEDDTHLVLTGVWLIDDVTYSADGLITIECRDLARVLLDQIMFPPVVPRVDYPLRFEAYHDVDNPDTYTGEWIHPNYQLSSNGAVGSTTEVQFGHHPADAVDISMDTYWLSTGFDVPDHPSSYCWWQGSHSGTELSAVKLAVRGGPYRVYMSVYTDVANGGGTTGWNGSLKIPYTPAPTAPENGSGILYSKTGIATYGGELTFTFPPVTGITKIRLTFTNLYKTEHTPGIYRAAVRDVQISTTSTVVVDGGTHVEGNYGDYTEIVRRLLAYGGFFWPQDGTQYLTGATTRTFNFDTPDPYLTTGTGTAGRVWGDLQDSGTFGPAALDIPVWDKKPLMDGVNYVKDVLGFLFFVDEQGAVIFRSPNIFRLGNWQTDVDGLDATRVLTYLTVRDDEAILGLRAKLSSRNTREHVFVANVNGKIGAVANGRVLFPAGLRRVGGWCVDTDTEIFTRRGWLRWDAVVVGDETLSLDADGAATWQAIQDVGIFPPQPRKMRRVAANNFDALTTPDHRWFVERYNTSDRAWRRRYATTEALTKLDRVARAAMGAAAPQATMTDALVELVAWAYTEGTVRYSRHGRDCGLTIYQSPAANPDNCEFIRLALKAEFGEDGWRTRLRKGCLEFVLSAAAGRRVLQHLSVDKAPTMAFLAALTQEQLDLFIAVSVAGDGHARFTSEFSSRESRFFYQTVGPRLDAFLSACALAGIATSVHVRSGEGNWHGRGEVATVTLLTNDYATIGQFVQVEQDYDGIVWCPSMPTHHNWLARRNGSVFYTGNTDQNFETSEECQIMADLIALRQLFTFRTDTLRIAANPAIQCDDQIKLLERTTGDAYFHYVRSISSSWDLAEGKWIYDLTTSWLGDSPSGEWAVQTDDLSAETQYYLAALGQI